jgi:hypothetical protein
MTIDFKTRQRTSTPIEVAMEAYKKASDQEKRRLAVALAVTEAEIEANGARLYYHGQELLDIEAASRESTASGRAALLDALFHYHDMGYASGTADGQMVAAQKR